ncbi:Hypothetical protein HDN1F_12310 [gamma proteobacterium HdN1]|nr:Hypothetical protein HDN1F_12310 [gamma proteobacterium HdN1]
MLVSVAHGKLSGRQTLLTIMGTQQLRIASEYEFCDRFLHCELGGMPPLGEPYSMRVFIERGLMNDNWIAFNAGTYTKVIKMDTGVFRRLVQPMVCSFGETH